MEKLGKVYFVGAGPGDPGLLTVRGRECLARAEVIIYDRLLAPMLVEQFRPEAEAICAGGKSREHTMTQEEVMELLVGRARQGKMVVRLKGGDPFVFGGGAEEVETVAAAGIPFEIVPGVTAAIAVPAYAGIPVTHKGLSESVAIVIGHDASTKGSAVNWSKLTTAADTLVFLMVVENLPQIVETLTDNGLRPDTLAAIIAQGTSPQQVTITGTIDTIAEQARKAGVSPPAVLVVGKVVALREKLSWFEERNPLRFF